MDQKKTGEFLKALRKEKELTQSQLAEVFNVSTRTVSRWENGSNLPDVSTLVEIADFYEVDVREIIEGERNATNEEISDMALKIAEYAGNEKSRLLKWIQIICFLGVFLLTGSIVLQCSVYSPDLRRSGAIFTSFMALVVMVAITLYVTGVLQKLSQKPKLVTVIKVVTIVLVFLSIRQIAMIGFIFGIEAWIDRKPYDVVSGIENYDKASIVEDNKGDMDSAFMIFPDSTEKMLEADYVSAVKSDIFDSFGYIILKAGYTTDDYKQEVERLSGITCEIKDGDNTYTGKVRFDETMYNYPAFIASDGYCFGYEYALLDEDNHTIIYVHLAYPDYDELSEYKDYLKKNKEAYDTGDGDTLDRFTIYAHRFTGEDYWTEYSDE